MTEAVLTLLQIVVLATIVEAVWETSKMAWQKGKLNVDAVGALVVGEIIAFTVQADILQILQFPENIPYVGIVLTGILISRGGNWVHDLIGRLQPTKGVIG